MEEKKYTFNPDTEENNQKKGLNNRIIAIVGSVLIVIIIALIWWLLSSSSDDSEKDATIAALQAEKEQLMLEKEAIQLSNEFKALDEEFQTIENQSFQIVLNDSIAQEYDKAKERLEELRKELKDEKNKSAKRIKELQSEIETLKGILRHYVEQIDALSKENEGLKAENAEMKSKNSQLTTQMGEVSQQKKVLEERMVLAEKLNVTGLTFTALNKRGKTEKKIAKAKQLEVSFTIPQNNSTPVGVKNMYLRITSPEGNLLGGAGTFEFEGSTLQCTASKQIEYGGEEIPDVKIYWDVNAVLTPGDYLVELFTDGYRLASRNFTREK